MTDTTTIRITQDGQDVVLRLMSGDWDCSVALYPEEAREMAVRLTTAAYEVEDR